VITPNLIFKILVFFYSVQLMRRVMIAERLRKRDQYIVSRRERYLLLYRLSLSIASLYYATIYRMGEAYSQEFLALGCVLMLALHIQSLKLHWVNKGSGN
jgi:hypothetical protein